MPIFSARSRANLITCHVDLQRLFEEVIREVDLAIICGHRSRADQDKALRDGFSETQWPKSKHNVLPSLAVDCVPCPVDWHDIDRFVEASAIIKLTATRLDIRVRWGGDFKTWKDYPHWELVTQEPEKG